MSVKKSPLLRTKEDHGSKEKLVDTLVSVLGTIQKSDEDKDTVKARLLAASNKKLLRLLEIGSVVKEKFGSVEKLAEETAKALGKAKDAPYVTKLKSLGTGKLYDMFRSATKSKAKAA